MDELYSFAESHRFKIANYPLPETKSISLPLHDICYVGLDNTVRVSEAVECCRLGHELGHCMYGGFYTRSTPCDVKEQHEYKADVWFIKHRIPASDLARMLREGRDVCEIAEILTVTEDYVMRAYYYYKESGILFEDEAG